MLPVLCAISGLFTCSAAPVPVILDTDLGDDIDDTWALAMLLGCPEVDLRLVVTASDDTHMKTRLVAKILEAMGRTDVPIGVGVKTSDRAIHQARWLGDYDLEGYKGRVIDDGVGAIIEATRGTDKPVTLLVIGPQTNIAAALRRDLSIAERARVVSMAGSVRVGYDGHEGRSAEYNVVKDVAAAQAVFAAAWPITLAPLDVCGTLRLGGSRYARVASSEARRARTAISSWRAKPHASSPSTSATISECGSRPTR